MTSFIRQLSRGTEFVLVTLVCYWWAIAANASALACHVMQVSLPIEMNDGRMLTLVVIELLGLGVASWLGYVRGWSLWSIGLRPSWMGTATGVLLAITTAFTLIVLGLLVNIVFPGAVRFDSVPGSLSLMVVMLVSVVNPILEEAIGVGYFTHALRKFGMWPVVLASAVFRTFMHSYQGLTAVIIILPLGVVFALVYWRWGRLWPLVVAHALISLAVLLPLTHAA